MSEALKKLRRVMALAHIGGLKGRQNYHIYELIWSIPKEYGGMTSAMLYRCFLFRRYNLGRSLTILTLQVDLDVEWAEKHIQDRWGVSKRVRIRNIWSDLRAASDSDLREFKGEIPEINEPAQRWSDFKKVKPFTHEFRDEAGNVFRREHLRKNGTLLLLVGVGGDPKTTILYDSAGRAIKQWSSTQELYLAWLEWAVSKRPAVLINEHHNISKFVYRAQFENVKIAQVVHSSHHVEQKTPYGELNNRANMVRNLGSFDLVSFLTEWQRQDLIALGVEVDNTCVIPNSTKPAALPLNASALNRSPEKGVAIARLAPGKQVGHMLRAMARIRDWSTACLHIYGDGKERESLRNLKAELGLSKSVIFKGHVSGVQDSLTGYSFLLFTSKSEGQGLVLLEAMARGCIPISYDIRYGPGDVITHGVDGFLVQPDDIDALAATIRHFLEMPEEERLAMRRAAIKRAEYFYPEQNMERWRTALNEVMSQPRRKPVKYGRGIQAVADTVVVQGGHCTIVGRLRGKPKDLALPAKIIVCTRKKASFLKLETVFETLSDTERRFTARFDLAHLPLRTVDYVDFHIQPVGALWSDKKRIGYGLDLESVQHPGCLVYKTKYGNLSLDCKGQHELSEG